MKLTASSDSHDKFQPVLIIAGVVFSLTSLFVQPLVVQALPHRITATQNSKQSKKIPYKRLIIGGISLSMSEAQVKKVLGKPLMIKNGYEAVAGKTRTLQYSGLTVKLLEDIEPTGKFFVYEIETNSSKYPTVDGVKVGDSILKVTRIYGRPQSRDAHSLSYEVEHSSPTYFTFTIQQGKVRKIICGDFLG